MARNALVIKGADFAANKLTTVTLVQDEKPCTAISLDESTKTVTALGNFTLTATVTPADTTDDVIWSTSDSTVATVSSGTVSVVGLGSATITATCGEQTATCAVTCSEITLSPDFAFMKKQNLTSYPNVYAYTESNRELMICAANKTYKSLKNGSYGDTYYPILVPGNTDTVELSYGSDMRAGTIYFGWIDSTESAYPDNYPNVAELVSMDSSHSSAYNQATTWSYTKPSGADSFAIIVTPVSTDYSESDTPEGIATAKGIVVKCKPAASSN